MILTRQEEIIDEVVCELEEGRPESVKIRIIAFIEGDTHGDKKGSQKGILRLHRQRVLVGGGDEQGRYVGSSGGASGGP